MNKFKQLTRWNEWADSKTPLFFAAAYTWLLTQDAGVSVEDVIRALFWLLFTACLLAFGYAINDYADAEPDRLAHKPNAISRLTSRQATLFLVTLALSGPASLFLYLSDRWVLYSLLIAYFFASTYSLPPIRFKERGTFGLFISSTAQRFFPLLVGMSVFDRFDLVSWIMGLLFSLMGVRWILVHQIGDIEADHLGGVNSFARTRGASTALRWMQWVIFPMELMCLLAWIALVARQTPIVLGALPLYGLWMLGAVRVMGRPPVSWTRFGELPLTHFYMIFWPVALALGAALIATVITGLAVIQFLWQRPYLVGEWRKLFPRSPALFRPLPEDRGRT